MRPWDSWKSEKPMRNILPQNAFNGYVPSKRVLTAGLQTKNGISHIPHFKVTRHFKGKTLK